MGDFPFAVQVWLSVIRNWAGRHHAGRCCSTGLGSCCSLGMNTLCFLFECASSQWKKVPGRLCTSQGFTGREERQVQSQRPPAPGSPGLPFAGGPGIVSAASADRGGRDRGAESSLCWWGSQPTHSLIKGPCVGGLWGSRGPPYSFDSWSSGSPRGQPRAARDAWWVAGPGLSGILLSPYLGCHFSAIPQNWLTHLPCTGRVGGCGCAGVSSLAALSHFHPYLPHSVCRKLTPPSSSPFCPIGWFLTYISQWEAPVGDWRGKGGPGGMGCFLPVSPGSGTSDLTVSRSSVTTATPGTTAPSSTGFHPFLLPGQA